MIFLSISLLDQTILRFYLYDLFSEIFLYKIDDKEYNDMLMKISKIDENFGQLVMNIANVNISEIREKFNQIKKKDYLIEYSTLFLTGLGNKPLVPVESKRLFVKLGEKIAMYKYSDIIRFYSSRRIVPKLGNNFVHEPDHISTILAFMSLLIKEEYELRKNNKNPFNIISDQINFATTHIVSWIPEWANDVINDDRSDIFKVVCKNLVSWIQYDYNIMRKAN